MIPGRVFAQFPAVELLRHQNILAIKTAGRTLGFHSHNLEVAEISDEAWSALKNSASSEALNELIEWNQFVNPDTKDSSNQFGIRSITLNVNQICNLHCHYCAAGGDGSYGDPVKKISIEKTLPQITWMLEKVPRGESFGINFLGGEPLLYPEALEMIGDHASEIAKTKGILLTLGVTTNGTLINEKVVSLFAKHKFNVTISIDGPAEINDRVRPSKNGSSPTAQIEKGLELLLKNRASLGAIRFTAVFNKENTEVLKAYRYFSQFDVDVYSMNFDATEQDQAASRKFTQEMSMAAREAFEHGGEPALRKIEYFDRMFERLDSQTRLNNYCGAGKSYFMVDARNQIFTCPWDVNNSKEMVGVDSYLSKEKLEPYQTAINAKAGCKDCWARNICGGGCMYIHQTKSGQKNQVDPEFCYRTRTLITEGLMYYLSSRQAEEAAHGNNH